MMALWLTSRYRTVSVQTVALAVKVASPPMDGEHLDSALSEAAWWVLGLIGLAIRRTDHGLDAE